MQTHPERRACSGKPRTCSPRATSRAPSPLRPSALRAGRRRKPLHAGCRLAHARKRVLEAAWHDYEEPSKRIRTSPSPASADPAGGQLGPAGRWCAYKQRILANRVEPRKLRLPGLCLLTAGDTDSALRVVETGLTVGPADPLHYREVRSAGPGRYRRSRCRWKRITAASWLTTVRSG